MTARALLIEVTLLEARYHGVGDWPPAPARLFQALVAGAYGGQWVKEDPAEKDAAFQWLEALPPPHIATPPSHLGSQVQHYVPNNSLDAVGNDPARVADIRVGKRVRPRFLDEPTLVYAWPYEGGDEPAARIAALANRLHTLGCGIDAAFAHAHLLDWDAAEEWLRRHGGVIARPVETGAGATDPGCPIQGSLASLKARYAATSRQLQPSRQGRTQVLNFTRPPKPLFRPVAYDRPSTAATYELRRETGHFAARPARFAVAVTTRIRDQAAALLKQRLPDQADVIDRLLIGLDAGPADKLRRVRLIPLPSIGTPYTDSSIRRLRVEVPPDCPLPPDEVLAVFAGLDLRMDPETGEILENGEEVTLVPTLDEKMLSQYGVPLVGKTGAGFRRWISVTPLALPARRRRLDPGQLQTSDPHRRLAEAKPGTERQAEEAVARAAVLTACRHAGIDPHQVLSVSLQREPFFIKGDPAEYFADPPRFSRHRLWHVALTFADPMHGPLLLGDGRWLGLGLMAPAAALTRQEAADAIFYTILPECRPPVSMRPAVIKAVRAALMSLARDVLGSVPTLFSGHEDGPAPARSGHHRHIYIAALDTDSDGHLDQIQVVAPWCVDRTEQNAATEQRETQRFVQVTNQLALVRAGGAGLLSLAPPEPLPAEVSAVWTSLTRYRPTRHPDRNSDPAAFLMADVRGELARRNLPAPQAIKITNLHVGPHGGLSARLTLKFAQAVLGPILLGRDAHRGGGMFRSEQSRG